MRLGVAVPAAMAALGGVLLANWSGAEARLLPWLSVVALMVLWICQGHVKRWVWVFIGAWIFISVQQEWGRQLPVGLSGEDVVLQARILSVQDTFRAQRLLLEVEACQAPAHLPHCDALRRVRVSAYDGHHYRVGERWEMALRLRPPQGFANPDTFNFAQWLWREGIHATGSLRPTPAPEQLSEASLGLRKQALSWLAQTPLEERTQRWLAALTLGASAQLNQSDWALLNATGTTHLVVISGLHVGLVASFTLLLARGVSRLVSPTNWRLRAWPWCVAAAATVGYAVLAGLAPPAMRAMVMTLLGLWVVSGRHSPGAWQAWWLALALILIINPLSFWRPGLWLSFIAVGWLIIIWQGRPRPRGVRGWCWALLRSQLLLSPLMAAAVLLAFGRVAPAAPLINLLAVPWVSSVMVPSALLGWVLAPLPGIGFWLWWVFEQALNAFHLLLTITAHYAPLWEPTPAMIYPLVAGLLLLALCWGLPAIPLWLRLASLVVVVLLPWVPTQPSLPEGELQVTVYDVGQGQLIELRSASYRMLYDTGPRFRSGFAPLQTLWPPGQRFDLVMVSHADIDHAGGVDSLLTHHVVERWLAPLGEALPVAAMACERGQQWQQDGIDYRVLWPPAGHNTLSPNDRSCVLEVSVGEQSLLITGDVGRDVERRFVADLTPPLSVLVAGHHGSHTSSGVQFVRLSRPRHVIFSAGRGNAFNHPADDVVRRFRQQESCLWNTADDGALRFTLSRARHIDVVPLRTRYQGRKRC